MLFKGVESFRSRSSFGDVDKYAEFLHAHNEQLSILLKLKNSVFAEQCENTICMTSLVLYLISIFCYFEPTVNAVILEDWKRDYLEMLELELLARTFRLVDRILRTEPAQLLRTMGLERWAWVAQKFWKEMGNDDFLLYRMFFTLFSVGIVVQRQFCDFILNLDINSIKGEDVVVLCMLISSAKIKIDVELPIKKLANLILAICRVVNVEFAMKSLMYLSRLPGLRFFVEQLSVELTDTETDADFGLLQDYLWATENFLLKDLSRRIDKRISLKAKVNELTRALPRLDISRAESVINKYAGDVTLAISKEYDKYGRDQFVEFLDDKSHVLAAKEWNLHMALAENLYEDEYVDTFDEDASSKNRDAGDINQQKVHKARRKLDFL